MRSLMQTQIIQQREEIQSQVSEMERRLNDKSFSHAEATRPAHSTLPVISSVESDVNESVHGVPEASLRSDPRFVFLLSESVVSACSNRGPLVRRCSGV